MSQNGSSQGKTSVKNALNCCPAFTIHSCIRHLITQKTKTAHAEQEVSKGAAFLPGEVVMRQTPYPWQAIAKVAGLGKQPFIPSEFNSLGLESVEYSMYRCFRKYISGAWPALDMLIPGRERSPLSLTSHLLPGQKKQHPSCAKCVKHHLSVALLKAQQAWINFQCMCSCSLSKGGEFVGLLGLKVVFFEWGDFSFHAFSPANFPPLYVMSQISVPGTDIRLFERELCFLVIYFSGLHFSFHSLLPQIAILMRSVCCAVYGICVLV